MKILPRMSLENVEELHKFCNRNNDSLLKYFQNILGNKLEFMGHWGNEADQVITITTNIEINGFYHLNIHIKDLGYDKSKRVKFKGYYLYWL